MLTKAKAEVCDGCSLGTTPGLYSTGRNMRLAGPRSIAPHVVVRCQPNNSRPCRSRGTKLRSTEAILWRALKQRKRRRLILVSRLASGSTKADEARRIERQTVLTTPQGSTTGDIRLRHKGYKHFVRERRTGDNVTSMGQVMRTT